MPIFLSQTSPVYITRSSLDTEDISIPVQLQLAGAYVDPTVYPLAFAFKSGGNPTTPDWQAGTWASTASGAYLAQINVGPAAYTPGAGLWNVWMRVTTSTEIPILIAAILSLT